jgi:hypothetical protein
LFIVPEGFLLFFSKVKNKRKKKKKGSKIDIHGFLISHSFLHKRYHPMHILPDFSFFLAVTPYLFMEMSLILFYACIFIVEYSLSSQVQIIVASPSKRWGVYILSP